MNAASFNHQHGVGDTFMHKPDQAIRGGRVVRTVDVARDLTKVTVVEINVEPYFVNIKSLTPVN
jgi:hypothetical protein